MGAFLIVFPTPSGGSGFYIRLNLLGVTQSVFFMVPEETQTSTSSTAAGITSGTECLGGDGPSSAVLGSAGQESTDSNTVSVVSTAAGTHVVHGCNTVTAERQNVKQSKKKTQQAELIKRQISEWGLKKPSSARNKVWDQAFKYDKCPKGTPNGWEHHAICKVCLNENVGNTVVKLGSSDSSQALVQHFLQHQKEEWEQMHKEKQSSITFTSRDSSGKSTRPSPLRKPTAEQHNMVDEKRKSVKRLFDSIGRFHRRRIVIVQCIRGRIVQCIRGRTVDKR